MTDKFDRMMVDIFPLLLANFNFVTRVYSKFIGSMLFDRLKSNAIPIDYCHCAIVT